MFQALKNLCKQHFQSRGQTELDLCSTTLFKHGCINVHMRSSYWVIQCTVISCWFRQIKGPFATRVLEMLKGHKSLIATEK